MALSYEKGVSLAFDTGSLRSAASGYRRVSTDLTTLRGELESLLSELSTTGWTTHAGKAFETMVKTDWSKNLDKYCDLIATLAETLERAADEYDVLIDGPVADLKLQ